MFGHLPARSRTRLGMCSTFMPSLTVWGVGVLPRTRGFMGVQPFPGQIWCKERCRQGLGEVTAPVCPLLAGQRLLASWKQERLPSSLQQEFPLVLLVIFHWKTSPGLDRAPAWFCEGFHMNSGHRWPHPCTDNRQGKAHWPHFLGGKMNPRGNKLPYWWQPGSQAAPGSELFHTNFMIYSLTPALSLAIAGAAKARRTGCRKTLTFFQAGDTTQREALELQERQIYTMAWPFLDSLQALAVDHSRDFGFRAVRFQFILSISLGSDLPHFSCRTHSRVCCAHLWSADEQHNLYIQADLTGRTLRLKPEPFPWAELGCGWASPAQSRGPIVHKIHVIPRLFPCTAEPRSPCEMVSSESEQINWHCSKVRSLAIYSCLTLTERKQCFMLGFFSSSLPLSFLISLLFPCASHHTVINLF